MTTPTDAELKCPLCGGKQTNFHDVYSDGDEIVRCSFRRQQCVDCGLPCKLWDRVQKLAEAARKETK